MAPRNTPPVDPAIYDMMIAANQYGSGPGYESKDFTDEQKKLNYIQDIFYNAGFNIDELMGIAPEPEDPGAAPMYTGFQNDMRSQYGANPVLNKAFTEIDTGQSDPYTTAAAIRQMVQDDPDMLQYLPTYTSDDPLSNGQPELNTSELESLLTTYAGNREKQLREQSEYAQTLTDYQTKRDAFDVYNNPTSEFELRGSPDLATDISAMKSQLNPKNFLGQAVAPKADVAKKQSYSDILENGNQASRYKSSRRPRGANAPTVKNDGKVLSRETNNLIAQMARYRQGKQKRNVRPAGRELDNRKRQQAIYMLMNGEPI